MADGKWIEDLRPDQSLSDAAAHTIRLRLEVVRDALAPAIAAADQDPEHVHRLRVATRRADAALRIFRSALPDKEFKAARKRLRRIRRAAGAVRDWDVFRVDVTGRRPRRPQKEHAGLDFLVGYALGRRVAAHPELEASVGKRDPHLHQFPRETAAAVSAPANGATLVQLARPLLSNLLHDLEKAADGDLTDYAHLHQVRIAGKRLRYAMEVFPSCFPEAFKESIYPQVEDMQEILGQANDSHVAAGHLVAARDRLSGASGGEWKRLRAGVEGMLRAHNTRLPQARRRFLGWWKTWTRGGGPALTELLRQVPAGSGGSH